MRQANETGRKDPAKDVLGEKEERRKKQMIWQCNYLLKLKAKKRIVYRRTEEK
jgi:hypothetical protein